MKIASPPPVGPPAGPLAAQRPDDAQSFGTLLKEAFGEVNRLRHEADRAVEGLASGRQTDIHGTMIAMEKASVSFKLLMQVRNKVIAAYDEIKRITL